MVKVFKQNKGITLIALVITIIVLLILAGNSITMLSGNNSILSKAGEAKKTTEEHQIAESVQLAYVAALEKGKGTITEPLLSSELDKYFSSESYNIDLNNEKVKIGGKDYGFDGTITDGEDTGLIEQADGSFKDDTGNEWVWIEVPNDGTGPTYPANATDEQIEAALRDYCDDVISKTEYNYKTATNGHTDTWYNGCGLGESEYNTTKSTMLNSIKDNGGFYIGKYETGIDGSSIAEDATETAGLRTSSGNTIQTPVIKKNMQPYTYVTCSQAENLSKGFATDGKTASLLFGIQWDLVLKYIKVKENLPDNSILITDSKDWGNYVDKIYTTDAESWYSTDNGVNWTKGVYNKDSYENTFLTTGAHIDFSKQEIYDIAGNVWEWTLEKTFDSSNPCTNRGGGCNNTSVDAPSSIRYYLDTNYSGNVVGFRVALY